MRSFVRWGLLGGAFVSLGCGDPVGPAVGELRGAIIAGRQQTVTAGAAQLPAAVVNQVVRSSTGALFLRAATDGASTVLAGSPVPGAVVCVYEQDKDLVPFARCTNTDADGKATFFFTPPTKAGDYIARINGTVTTNGKVEATTFDTAKATVEPGPTTIAPALSLGSPDQSVQFVGATFTPTVTDGKDAFGNVTTSGIAMSVSTGLTLTNGVVRVDSVGTLAVHAVGVNADITRSVYAFDDPRKGVLVASTCLGGTSDSVVYTLSGTPATVTLGAVDVTSAPPFAIVRDDWSGGVKTTQTISTSAYTFQQRADSAFASSSGIVYAFKRSGIRAYAASQGTLCPSNFTTKGVVRLTVK